LSWYNDELVKANLDLMKVRREIQETKFAVLLGKCSFDEFNSREENTITVDANVFTFSINEVKVEI